MSQSDEGSHILAAQDNEEERRKRLFKVTNSKHSNTVTWLFEACTRLIYWKQCPYRLSC
jgi:hypothetical protein